MEVSIFYKSVTIRFALNVFLQKKKIILFKNVFFWVIFDFFFHHSYEHQVFLLPSPHPPSKNECKEILLGCLVMYFLWGHTRRCLTPCSSCYKHTEDAFHLGFAFQPGWPLLNKKDGGVKSGGGRPNMWPQGLVASRITFNSYDNIEI